ncbi:MAG: hypothetical protein ACI9S8_003290 [Chlamydiales bacterium]|jgi:hypothetical protein
MSEILNNGCQGPGQSSNHCDKIIKNLATGKAVAFNGREFAVDTASLENSAIPIVDLLEHTQTVRKKDYIPSEVLQKFKEIGEESKVSDVATKVLSIENPELNNLIKDLDQRILITKMFEEMESFKREA